MRPLRLLLLLAFIALPAFSATRLTYWINGAPVPVAWKTFPITYAIDTRVAAAMPQAASQVERAVNEWTTVPGAQINFQSLAGNDAPAGRDGQNSVTLVDDLFANQHFIAQTTSWNDDNDGHLVEAEIQIDPTAITAGYNLQQIIE